MKKYFVYDPQNSLEVYDTLEEAEKEAADAIQYYLDGTWDTDVENIQMGIITHEVKMTNMVKRPEKLDEDDCDEDGFCWTGEFDYKCDYEMLPLTTKEDK